MKFSYCWKEDEIWGYTTNNGGVQVDVNHEVINCIYAIGKNQSRQLEVQIDNYTSFRVATRPSISSGYKDELTNDRSLSRSYGNALPELPMEVVLDCIENDDDESYAGIAVKRCLMKCLSSMKMDAACKRKFKGILDSWRSRVKLDKKV
jgi:hypothetical protein